MSQTKDSGANYINDITVIKYELKNFRNAFKIILDNSKHSDLSHNLENTVDITIRNQGADGLIIEVHHNPEEALSDAEQTLYPEQFKELLEKICPVCCAIGKKLDLR